MSLLCPPSLWVFDFSGPKIVYTQRLHDEWTSEGGRGGGGVRQRRDTESLAVLTEGEIFDIKVLFDLRSSCVWFCFESSSRTHSFVATFSHLFFLPIQ